MTQPLAPAWCHFTALNRVWVLIKGPLPSTLCIFLYSPSFPGKCITTGYWWANQCTAFLQFSPFIAFSCPTIVCLYVFIKRPKTGRGEGLMFKRPWVGGFHFQNHHYRNRREHQAKEKAKKNICNPCHYQNEGLRKQAFWPLNRRLLLPNTQTTCILICL